MDLVLHSGAFTHQLGTTAHPSPRKTRRLLGQPHLWEKARPEKLGEGAGVELVGLGSGIPDAPCDRGVGDNDSCDVWLDQSRDGERVADRLEADLIVRVE